MSDPEPLAYSSVRTPKPQPMSGCAPAAIGIGFSVGPIGLGIGWIAGQLLAKVGLEGHPYPDSTGIRAFMIRLITWFIVAFVGTLISIVLGLLREERRRTPDDEPKIHHD